MVFMKTYTITTQFTRDNLENLFLAATEHSFTFSNFNFDNDDNDHYGIVTFDLTTPNNLTKSDFMTILHDYDLSDLADSLNS